MIVSDELRISLQAKFSDKIGTRKLICENDCDRHGLMAANRSESNVRIRPTTTMHGA